MFCKELLAGNIWFLFRSVRSQYFPLLKARASFKIKEKRAYHGLEMGQTKSIRCGGMSPVTHMDCELKPVQKFGTMTWQALCFFWNVKWKEITLKTFQGGEVGCPRAWSEILSSVWWIWISAAGCTACAVDPVFCRIIMCRARTVMNKIN